MTVNPLLLAFVKKHLRVSASTLDDEIDGLIQSAVADMNMRGVDTVKLVPDGAAADALDPLIVRAIVYYSKANFGVANKVEESEQYYTRYDGLTQAMSYAGGTRLLLSEED